jgi:uncharacterized membrane protein YfcA
MPPANRLLTGHIAVPYSPHELAVIALIMTFGSVVQGAVGFASGLMGVPILVLCGFSLLDAMVINFVSTCLQNVAGAVQLWSHLDPSELVWPNVWRCVGLPLGILALDAVGGFEPDRVRQIIGLLLLLSVVLIAGLRFRPRERVHPLWVAVAFTSSGFLMGFASIGGAPMVMYVNSLTWSAAKSRGFLFFCSSALMPFTAVMLLWKFGATASHPAMAALMVMPPVLVGLWVGLKLGHRLDKTRFRRLTYSLLVAIAVGAIASPYVASLFQSR